MSRLLRLAIAPVLVLLAVAPAFAQAPVAYRLSFPEPAHHWVQVQATFKGASASPLHIFMSRTSPGRYAMHEFAKNVYDVKAFNGAGHPLHATRSRPFQWDVTTDDGTVRMEYKVYGDRVDGTYLAVDLTHAHINMPAVLMWADGLENRPIRIQFDLPPALHWRVATQLHATADPQAFTGANLQYVMDSPAELGTFTLKTFQEGGRTFRISLHEAGDQASRDADAFVRDVQKVVHQEGAVYGEFPNYEPGYYTFLSDYLPWASGDGMEHRNSTVMTFRGSLGDPQQRIRILNTVAHEFFHCWNVERIRPRGIEPFDFEHLDMSEGLWLAEGFTNYYGTLLMQRAGLTTLDDTVQAYARVINAVTIDPGRQVRTAEQMSAMAPFIDGGATIDRTNWTNTVISYYTWGDAIGLALDLSLRERTNGRVTLDDFMRAMWQTYGKPGGPAEGLVGHPYSMDEAQQTLAKVAGDQKFAEQFFADYVAGHDVARYKTLLAPAGLVLQPAHPDQAWIGNLRLDYSDRGAAIQELVPTDSPAYRAGLEQDDTITSIDGHHPDSEEALGAVLAAHKPGDRVSVEFTRRDGARATATMTIAADPRVELVPIERAGGTLTPAQQAFRKAWLGAH